VTAQSMDDAFAAAVVGAGWGMRVLHEALAPRVLGYLRSRGAAEPEDLTSEVFLAVLPRLNTVQGGVEGLTALLFSVAHARLVDDLRRRSRRGPTVPYEPERDARLTASAEDDALAAAGTARVERLLAALAPDQRDVLSLRLIGDLTVEQIAATLGKTTGAVKQLQRRGLDQLRKAVEAEAIPLQPERAIGGER
jgi:RNA polymerase sigma-70 factor (ECF subfamily)